MSSTKLEQAEQRLAQTEAVRTMIARVRAWLAGRMTRAEMKTWTREFWPPASRGSPFSSPDANWVFDSLLSLEQRSG